MLVGAKVSARQIETNQIRNIEVDEKGGFRFLKLPPGVYEVTASADNFNPQTEKLVINIGRTFLRFSPVSSQIQFGSFFSGPIKKDKIFFFLSFERFLSKSSIPIDVKENIVEAFRRRNFSVRTGLLSIPDTTVSLLGRLDWQTSANNSIWIRYNFGGVYQGRAETFGGVEFENVGGARRLNDSVIAFNNTYFSSENNFVHETRFLFSNRDQKVPAQDSLPDTIVVENGTLGRAGTFFRLPQVLKEQVYQV